MSLDAQMDTVFVCLHAHAQIDVHSSLNSSRTWKFLSYFCILQPAKSAKCGSNIEISKLCMHNSGHVSLIVSMGEKGNGLTNV